jgi:hypothetical protein
MMCYPGAFKKAYEEIVQVIGTERLPTFDDRTSLPYGMYANLWNTLIIKHVIDVNFISGMRFQ